MFGIRVSVLVYMLQACVLLASTVILYWIEFLLLHTCNTKDKSFRYPCFSPEIVTDSRDNVIIIYQTTLRLVLLVRNRITEHTCCV